MRPDIETLKKARRWCAGQFARRRKEYEHASFEASKILLEAEERYGLDTFGVEGWASQSGTTGVEYLNTGDSYALTLAVRTTHGTARFMVTSFASLAGG